MKVLVACEESQAVCKAFREKGHYAFSCDIQDCSGGHPEWHIKGDVLPLLNGVCSFVTQNGDFHEIHSKWDLIIAHPPCTYLTVTGNRWFNVERYGEKAIQRSKDREEAISFFMVIANAKCDRIVIENPVGVMSTVWRTPDQIIQPFMFGDAFEKKTCLWLKGVIPLVPSNEVDPPERVKFDSGKSMPKWYADLWHLPKDERSRLRSQTFPGFARAMAEQWGGEFKAVECLEQWETFNRQQSDIQDRMWEEDHPLDDMIS